MWPIRGGKLLLTVAVAVVLLQTLALLHSKILVSLWRPMTNNTMQLPQFRLDTMKDVPLHISVTVDASSNHFGDGARITSHINYSANATGPHIRQTFHRLEKEFEDRHVALLRECNKYDARIANPGVKWRMTNRDMFPGPFMLFRVPKAGYTALMAFVAQMKKTTPTTPRPLSAVLVRHPLSRLASAYRDKFLTGKSLSEYNDKWRKVTHSGESWDTRFDNYWLPALVSQGFLHRTRKLNETLNKIRRAYQVYSKNYISQSSAPSPYPSQEENQFYDKEEKKTAYQMMVHGPYIGFSMILKNAYNISDLQQRYRNTSFTFNQFLRHVVWTHDMGMPDQHWMTYTEMCDPCRIKYDYILKLETIQEEIQHLFFEMLGFPNKVSFPVKHRSYGHSLGHNDREYYANVNRELMLRLLDIYRPDFAIFGYSEDL